MQTLITEFEIVKGNYSNLIMQLNSAHSKIESHAFLITKLTAEVNNIKRNKGSNETDLIIEPNTNNKKNGLHPLKVTTLLSAFRYRLAKTPL